MADRIYLMDCTLRDGGYINDWEFSRDIYDAVSKELQTANVDFIELGIMGSHNADHFKTKFRSLEEIPVPRKPEGSRSQFTVMMTGAEYKKMAIPGYTADNGVDALRYAFFKADIEEALMHMEELIGRGYKVFAQTMATFQYTDDELSALVRGINRIKPYAFYIVDSFGTLYPEDIRHLYHLVDDTLDKDILFGIHAHNNLQMANANVITFIDEAEGRSIIVDGSIYGMGRGAGNAQTEILMHYLNRNGGSYNDDIVWKLYVDWFADLRKQFAWGYLPEQFLVSKYETNPAYVWYLSRKGITDFQEIKAVLGQIPADKKYTLFRDEADRILENRGNKNV